MRGRAAFGGTAGGAVAPLTTQGRLAPAGLGPELALRALRAVERQLGRLVICQVGREAILLIRPPDQSALDAAGIRATCSALTLLILGRRLAARTAAALKGTRRRNGSPTVKSIPSRRLTHQSPWEACSCTPLGSGVAICENFLTTSLP
jgi:hypothetical protein